MAELFDFQEDAIAELQAGKHFIISGTGSGKTAMAVNWLVEMCNQTGKRDVLIVTTASKSKTGDFEQELEEWHPSFSDSLSSLLVLSWHKLAAWVAANLFEISKYVIVFDEIQKGSAGVSSAMGNAFLKICV